MSDWSSDLCSSDLLGVVHAAMLAALVVFDVVPIMQPQKPVVMELIEVPQMVAPPPAAVEEPTPPDPVKPPLVNPDPVVQPPAPSPSPMLAAIRPPKTERSEEHTSELQSLMRSSYAVFCLKKQK